MNRISAKKKLGFASKTELSPNLRRSRGFQGKLADLGARAARGRGYTSSRVVGFPVFFEAWLAGRLPMKKIPAKMKHRVCQQKCQEFAEERSARSIG